MQEVIFTTEIQGNSFDVCLNASKFCRAFRIFELRQNGEHFEYFYLDNLTGEYFLDENPKITLQELEHIYPVIQERLSLMDNYTLEENRV